MLNIRACLCCPAALANPKKAPALYESCFGKAQQSGTTCCLLLDNHVYGGVTFGKKLWRDVNNIVGASDHIPLTWPMLHELNWAKLLFWA